jgi:hypothetical protein
MLRTVPSRKRRISRHPTVRRAADRCLLCTRVAVGSTATAVTGECVYAARAIMGDIPAAETATSADAS